jgi:hypothetical protein
LISFEPLLAVLECVQDVESPGGADLLDGVDDWTRLCVLRLDRLLSVF